MSIIVIRHGEEGSVALGIVDTEEEGGECDWAVREGGGECTGTLSSPS